jgi:hypothetical protein
MSFTKLACLSVMLIGSFDESPSPPPSQRVVSGEDLRLLRDLEARLDAARAADNFPEAIAAAEQILAVRQRRQGADHWETLEARLDLADLREIVESAKAGPIWGGRTMPVAEGPKLA